MATAILHEKGQNNSDDICLSLLIFMATAILHEKGQNNSDDICLSLLIFMATAIPVPVRSLNLSNWVNG